MCSNEIPMSNEEYQAMLAQIETEKLFELEDECSIRRQTNNQCNNLHGKRREPVEVDS